MPFSLKIKKIIIRAYCNMSPAEYEKRYFEKENLSKKETEVKLCA